MKSAKTFALSTIVLCTALLAGSAAAEQPSCLKLKDLHADEEVAIGSSMMVELKFKTHDCHLPLGGAPITTISLDAAPGSAFAFQADDWQYGKKSRLEKHPEKEVADEVKVKASVTPRAEVSTGRYQVAGVVSYQTIDRDGTVTWQNTPIIIPVKVVLTYSQVHQHPRTNAWKIIGEVGLGVVMVPVIVVAGIFQIITGVEIFPNC